MGRCGADNTFASFDNLCNIAFGMELIAVVFGRVFCTCFYWFFDAGCRVGGKLEKGRLSLPIRLVWARHLSTV